MSIRRERVESKSNQNVMVPMRNWRMEVLVVRVVLVLVVWVEGITGLTKNSLSSLVHLVGSTECPIMDTSEDGILVLVGAPYCQEK